MASATIRATFRTELQTAFPSVPFVDTIARNVDRNTLPALWMGVEFMSEGERRVSIGYPTSLWREAGTCFVMVVGASGAGDSVVSNQAALVREHFRNWQNPSIGLRVVRVEIQSSVGEESEGRWFLLPVAIEYERDFYA